MNLVSALNINARTVHGHVYGVGLLKKGSDMWSDPQSAVSAGSW